MRYSVSLPIGGVCGDARVLGEFAALAEQSGWDGVFLEDYIIYQNRQDLPTCDPWVALAVMAMRTERIRLGTEVTPIARRRPWKVAREIVTLDHLSNGRLIVGFGLGDSSDMSFTHFGEETDAGERAGMLDEALDILVGLWSGEPFSYAGAHYRVREVMLLPRPLQEPRIPIWIGGSSQRRGPVRRAARWDGFAPVPIPAGADGRHLNAAEIRHLRRTIEEQRTGSGPFDVAVGGLERGSDWEAERRHIASVAAAGATWWIEGIPPGELGAMRASIERGPLRAI